MILGIDSVLSVLMQSDSRINLQIMEDVIDKADKETGFLAEAQPLYIDEINLKS